MAGHGHIARALACAALTARANTAIMVDRPGAHLKRPFQQAPPAARVPCFVSARRRAGAEADAAPWAAQVDPLSDSTHGLRLRHARAHGRGDLQLVVSWAPRSSPATSTHRCWSADFQHPRTPSAVPRAPQRIPCAIQALLPEAQPLKRKGPKCTSRCFAFLDKPSRCARASPRLPSLIDRDSVAHMQGSFGNAVHEIHAHVHGLRLERRCRGVRVSNASIARGSAHLSRPAAVCGCAAGSRAARPPCCGYPCRGSPW
jgi:hypothetical protein